MRKRSGPSRCRIRAGEATVVALALAVCLSRAAIAASLSLSVSPQSVETGEAATLTVTLTGGSSSGNPQFKLPDGARLAGGPNRRQMFTSVGRKTTVSIQYTYRIVFTKPGNYTLGPATIRTRRGVVRSGRSSLAVRAAGKLTGVAVVATIEPARVYVGQAVVATFVFGISRDIRGYELAVPFLKETQGLRIVDPENLLERWAGAEQRGQRGIAGHTVLSVADPQVRAVARQEQRTIDGVPCTAFVVERVIVPQEPGTYEFGSARAGANVIVGKTRRRSPSGRDPFDGFFSDDIFGRTRYKTKAVYASSDPLKLEVLPPPEEGRPPGYEGAVGRFELAASVSPRETTLGGPPFELTFIVKGEGNIETVGVPRFPGSPDFRLGVPEQQQRSRFEGGRLVGEKRFSLPVRPGSARLKEIPSAALVAFDPFAEKYVTLRTEPIAVTVTVPADSGALETVGLPEEVKAERRARQIVHEDVEDIETKVDPTESHEAWLHSGRGILVFAILPACACAALAAYAARWRKLREDETLARRVSAERKARSRLKELYGESSSLGTAEFAEGLSRALQEYLADKLGRPAGEIPPAEAESLLEDAGVGERSAREFASLLEEAEAARFGGALRHTQDAAVVSLSNGGGGDVGREEWLEQAWRCVDALEKGVTA